MIVLHQANPMKQQHRKRVVIAPEKVIISGDVQNTKPNRLLTKKMNTWDDILVVLHSWYNFNSYTNDLAYKLL